MENTHKIDDQKVKEHFNQKAKLHKNDHAVLDSSTTPKAKHDNYYHHYASLRAIKTYIPKNNQLTILDFGCGTGRFFPFLSKSFKKVMATDISNEMLNIAKNRANRYKNIEVITYDDFNNIELKVDLAYTFWVLAHCSNEQLRHIFHRMYSILNPHGVFYIFEQVSKNHPLMSDVYYRRSIDDYISIANDEGFICKTTKNIIRYPSYARSLWSKMPSWCSFLLPILYFIETKTLNRKPEFVEYYTSLIVFKKNINFVRPKINL